MATKRRAKNFRAGPPLKPYVEGRTFGFRFDSQEHRDLCVRAAEAAGNFSLNAWMSRATQAQAKLELGETDSRT
jgi:predicted HicB family RNase H-like nuclease